MRFLALARTHFRLAARQRALWIVSLGLALLSVTITVNPGLSFETDNPAALALTAQMLALMPPVAYAAAFTDLASEDVYKRQGRRWVDCRRRDRIQDRRPKVCCWAR